MTSVKLFAGLFAAIALAGTANAGTFNFSTGSGATTSGGSVNATATVTTNSNSITVTLTNLQQNPHSDSQLISGLTFKVAGAAPIVVTGIGSGITASIASDGSHGAGTTTSPLSQWQQISTTAGSINLTALTGNKPNELIIGPDSSGAFTGTYANQPPLSSIIQHNPVVLGTATFTFSVAGVTDLSQITNVVFQFGTQAGSDTVNATVPEPGSIAVWGVLALVGFGYTRRRKVA